jgi:hypothetical protein
MVIPPEERKALEKMGEARVRNILQYGVGGGLQGASADSAVEWIDEKDKKRLVKQRRMDVSTLIAAIVAALVALAAWIHPIH